MCLICIQNYQDYASIRYLSPQLAIAHSGNCTWKSGIQLHGSSGAHSWTDIQFKLSEIQILLHKSSNRTVKRSWDESILFLAQFITKKSYLKFKDWKMLFDLWRAGNCYFLGSSWFLEVIESGIEVFVTLFQNHFFFELMFPVVIVLPWYFFMTARVEIYFSLLQCFWKGWSHWVAVWDKCGQGVEKFWEVYWIVTLVFFYRQNTIVLKMPFPLTEGQYSVIGRALLYCLDMWNRKKWAFGDLDFFFFFSFLKTAA